MGLAIDTICTFKANPGSSGAAAVVATGDSLTIRNFAPTDFAKLESITRFGTTTGFVEVTSPLLHDNVRGIKFTTAESPSTLLLPKDVGQPIQPSDSLAVTISGGTAETDVAILRLYYSNVLGTAARLHSWGDISGNVKNIKPLEVDCNASGTVGQWTDTVITTTEDLLHVNSDYAVLGFITDTSLAAIGVKGQETGNLRVCSPGTTTTDDTSDYWIREDERMGAPHIPVISGINKGSIFASVVNDGATASVKVQLVLAELVNKLAS
jgi:hypothetical protein